MSTIIQPSIVVWGLLAAGCASQSEQSENTERTGLPAPVRDSSIQAQPVPEPVLFENQSASDIAILSPASQTPLSEPDHQSSESLLENDQTIETTEPNVAPTPQEAPKPEVAVPASEEAEASAEVDVPALPEVVGVVQSALPEEEVALVADETKTESDVATYLLNEAENSVARGNYEKARGQAQRALTIEPTAARAYLILARIELAEGRNEKAIEMARLGLASSAESNETFEQLNQILGDLIDAQPEENPEDVYLDLPSTGPQEPLTVPQGPIPVNEGSLPEESTPETASPL